MSELSKKARALLEAGRAELPSAAARDRMRLGVQARAAASSGGPHAWAWGGTAVAALAGLSVALWLWRPAPVEPPPVPVSAPRAEPPRDRVAPSVVVEPAPAPSAAPAVAPSAAAPPRVEPTPPAEPGPTVAEPPAEPAPPDHVSTLAAEIRLLRRAQLALQDPGGALAALEWVAQHERTFPQPILGEERDALRVLALCAAGRKEEARSRAAEFLRATPQSPQAARIRASCAAQPASAP